MRRRRSRPAYSLLPLMVLIIGLSVWGAGGITQMLARTIGSDDMKHQITAQMIHEAIVSHQNGDTRSANMLLSEAVGVLGNSSSDYIAVGNLLTKQGCSDEAVHLLNQAAQDREYSWNPLIWSTLGRAYTNVGDTAQAETANVKAKKAADDLYGSINLKPANDRDRALLSERLSDLATYYDYIAHDNSRAITVYAAAVSLNPENAEAMSKFGYKLADKGTKSADFVEAIRLTKKAVGKSPDSGIFLDSYGWALYKNQDYCGARRVLSDASQHSGDLPEIHYHLGEVYIKLGQPKDAIIEFDRALILRPDYLEARSALSSVTAFPSTTGGAVIASPPPKP